MSLKAELQESKLDIVKLITAFMLVMSAVAVFYYYAEQSLLVRVVVLLAAIAIAIAVALQTDRGRQVRVFLKDAQIEVRKVVWPTRQETVRNTLIVLLMVLVVAMFLWLLDMLLAWIVRVLTD